MTADVWIDVRFRGMDEVPASVVSWGLSRINEALRENAADDLALLAREMPELPRDAVARAIERLHAGAHDALQVVDTKRGSLGVIAVCPALAVWMLERTLGATGARGGADLHERLARVLGPRLAERRRAVVRRIEAQLSLRDGSGAPHGYGAEVPPEVVVTDISGDSDVVVLIAIAIDPEDFAPRTPVAARAGVGAAGGARRLRGQMPLDPSCGHEHAGSE